MQTKVTPEPDIDAILGDPSAPVAGRPQTAGAVALATDQVSAMCYGCLAAPVPATPFTIRLATAARCWWRDCPHKATM